MDFATVRNICLAIGAIIVNSENRCWINSLAPENHILVPIATKNMGRVACAIKGTGRH
jgi:hypothetical protein